MARRAPHLAPLAVLRLHLVNSVYWGEDNIKSNIPAKIVIVAGAAGGSILAFSLLLVTLFVCFSTTFGCLMGVGLGIVDQKRYRDLKRDQRPFDAELWKAAHIKGTATNPIRGKMIDDLLNRYDFAGWTESEVVDLLGPPNHSNTEHRMVWYSLGTYNHDFILKYDENGQVIKYYERWDP